MTFTAQIDDLTTALRHTRSRLLAPLGKELEQLPRDPEVFVEDVLLYVMDEWARDLREQGHVLEEDERWNDGINHYPRYILRMAGGAVVQLHFTGNYPQAMFLTISKGFRNGQQFSDARQITFELPLTNDPNKLLATLFESLRTATV